MILNWQKELNFYIIFTGGVMDKIKDIIEDVVNKIKSDKDFAKKFNDDPVKTLEGVIGIDLPDDKINEVIDMVKAKIKIDDSKVLGKLKNLFK